MLKRIVVGGVLQPTSSGEVSVSSSNREYERGYLPRYCMSRKGRGEEGILQDQPGVGGEGEEAREYDNHRYNQAR